MPAVASRNNGVSGCNDGVTISCARWRSGRRWSATLSGLLPKVEIPGHATRERDETQDSWQMQQTWFDLLDPIVAFLDTLFDLWKSVGEFTGMVVAD